MEWSGRIVDQSFGNTLAYDNYVKLVISNVHTLKNSVCNTGKDTPVHPCVIYGYPKYCFQNTHIHINITIWHIYSY
jgi:hypothetical protein